MCVLMYCKLVYIHDSPVMITRVRNNTPEKPWKAWKYWLFALLKGGKKKKKRNLSKIYYIQKANNKNPCNRSGGWRELQSRLFHFQWEMELGQSRTRNLNFSQCLSLLPYTTPAEGNLSEEEKRKRKTWRRGESRRDSGRKKNVNKSLLVSKILY